VLMNGNLKRLRQQRALSLSDLASMTKLSRVTINRIENGKQRPRPRTIRRLAEVLGVPVEELTSAQARFV
jgi:transcriptional regulator with XRE-family HTH domain